MIIIWTIHLKNEKEFKTFAKSAWGGKVNILRGNVCKTGQQPCILSNIGFCCEFLWRLQQFQNLSLPQRPFLVIWWVGDDRPSDDDNGDYNQRYWPMTMRAALMEIGQKCSRELIIYSHRLFQQWDLNSIQQLLLPWWSEIHFKILKIEIGAKENIVKGTTDSRHCM